MTLKDEQKGLDSTASLQSTSTDVTSPYKSRLVNGIRCLKHKSIELRKFGDELVTEIEDMHERINELKSRLTSKQDEFKENARKVTLISESLKELETALECLNQADEILQRSAALTG